jgi:hypothetical protein
MKPGASPQAVEEIVARDSARILGKSSEEGGLLFRRSGVRRLAIIGDHTDHRPFDKSFGIFKDNDATLQRVRTRWNGALVNLGAECRRFESSRPDHLQALATIQFRARPGKGLSPPS